MSNNLVAWNCECGERNTGRHGTGKPLTCKKCGREWGPPAKPNCAVCDHPFDLHNFPEDVNDAAVMVGPFTARTVPGPCGVRACNCQGGLRALPPEQ